MKMETAQFPKRRLKINITEKGHEDIDRIQLAR
jgi:hypothetical protein